MHRVKYNMLTPIKKIGNHYPGGNAIWKFKCDCGRIHIALLTLVKHGNTTRCKRCSKIRARTANLKHGKKGSRVYSIYRGMRSRCGNKSHDAYYRYHGRDILVCKRWLKFENFYADMGDPPSLQYTLDRINNDKGYSKKNCRWATKKEQNRNSRGNIIFTYKGVTACLAEICEKFKVPYCLVWDRINKSYWSIEDAITIPKLLKKKKRLAAEKAGIAT